MLQTKLHFTPFHVFALAAHLCPHRIQTLKYLSLFLLSLSPIYSCDLLSVYTQSRNLRSSSDNGILCITKLRTKTFWHRSFSFAAPIIWNSLLTELRHTDSIQKYKSEQKIHLFWEILYMIHYVL